MKSKKYIGRMLFTVIIGTFLIIGTLDNLNILNKPIERLLSATIDFPQFITEVKDSYVLNFNDKERFINLNGLFARVTGQHVYNEVSVLNNGMLDYECLEQLDMSEFASGIKTFETQLTEEKINFTYVQVPCKSDLSDTLLGEGSVNYGNKNATELIGLLKTQKTKVLDLRTSITATVSDVESYFYHTDHHWNTKGAFVAYGGVLEYLKQQFPDKKIDLSLANCENWEQTIYKDWFLGSHGKRVGIYFGGVDDLTIYTPKFETRMSMYVPKHHAHYSGSFEDTVIKSEYLDTPDYFHENPYCAYIGGDYPLVYHKNDLAENDLKVLMIKDSFSLPMQSFLSTAIRELEVLDPRYYNETTVAEYVMKSNPDIVLMMVNPSMFENESYYRLS